MVNHEGKVIRITQKGAKVDGAGLPTPKDATSRCTCKHFADKARIYERTVVLDIPVFLMSFTKLPRVQSLRFDRARITI